MGHAAELQELFDIMEILEVPVFRHYTNIAVYRPSVMPETLDQVLDLMESNIRPRIESIEVGHSVTRNLYNLLMSALGGINATGVGSFGDGQINMKDVGGTIRGITNVGLEIRYADCIHNTAFGNYTQQGIWVGTGSSGESFEDYILDTKITHGDGGGSLRYFGQLVPKAVWDGGTRQWTITNRRYFTNHSGGSISVAEMAMIIKFVISTITYYALVARDVLGSPVAVADQELLMAEYELVTGVWPS